MGGCEWVGGWEDGRARDTHCLMISGGSKPRNNCSVPHRKYYLYVRDWMGTVIVKVTLSTRHFESVVGTLGDGFKLFLQ